MRNVPIHDIAGFQVVRGDLVPGGLKRLGIEPVLHRVRQREVVCAVDPRGHSGLALAYAALPTRKKIHLFMAGQPVETYVTAELKNMPHVHLHFTPECTHQQELTSAAEKFANDVGAYIVPIGFNYEPFLKAMTAVALRLKVDPSEVWVPVGSGTTLKCLKRAWPKANLKSVNLGMMSTQQCKFTVPELPTETAQNFPPWPAASFYDAKLWRFIKDNASPDALIWLVA
jgi:hypothetical protein